MMISFFFTLFIYFFVFLLVESRPVRPVAKLLPLSFFFVLFFLIIFGRRKLERIRRSSANQIAPYISVVRPSVFAARVGEQKIQSTLVFRRFPTDFPLRMLRVLRVMSLMN